MEEEYRLLLTGELRDDFREELKKKAEECGVSLSFSSEISMKGENRPLLRLIAWILEPSRLDMVRHLKPGP